MVLAAGEGARATRGLSAHTCQPLSPRVSAVTPVCSAGRRSRRSSGVTGVSQTLPHGAERVSQPLSKSRPSFCQRAFDVRAEVTAPFHLLSSQKGHEADAGCRPGPAPCLWAATCWRGGEGRPRLPAIGGSAEHAEAELWWARGRGVICEHRAWALSAPARPSSSPLRLWFPGALGANSTAPSQGASCLAQLRPSGAGWEPGAPWFRSPLLLEGD